MSLEHGVQNRTEERLTFANTCCLQREVGRARRVRRNLRRVRRRLTLLSICTAQPTRSTRVITTRIRGALWAAAHLCPTTTSFSSLLLLLQGLSDTEIVVGQLMRFWRRRVTQTQLDPQLCQQVSGHEDLRGEHTEREGTLRTRKSPVRRWDTALSSRNLLTLMFSGCFRTLLIFLSATSPRF